MMLLCLFSFPLVSIAAVVSTQHQASRDTFFYKGHDLSSLKILEDTGSIYRDTSRQNQTRPADDILADGGMNTVRLRLWVNPSSGTSGLAYNLELARRFQKKGFRLYLDFHFSDSWADPAQQSLPAGWPTTLELLAQKLRGYVKETLIAFSEAEIKLDIVSLGNEIQHGMLWPLGFADVDLQPKSRAIASFFGLATLYKAARAGVDDATFSGLSKPQVMIHIADGWNLTLQQLWFEALVANSVPTSAWDVFGFSFYPYYNTAATFGNLRTTLNTLALRYRKQIQVVETDYPAICNRHLSSIPTSSEPRIQYSVDGQISWMRTVLDIVKQVPYGLGRGLYYWEPAWLNNTSLGSDCDDAILFESENTNGMQYVGYSRPAVNVFQY